MDYFKDAFDGFAPQSDPDASLKLALDALFADQRIEDLTELVMIDSQLGGVEGEPGWLIVRRGAGEKNWPEGAQFRTYVRPDSYSLAHPEFYCDRKTFYRYVQSIVDVYAKRHPGEMESLGELREIISQ